MQVDPLADLSFNYSPYVYGNSNPILFNDPLGLVSDTAWKVLSEVVITAVKKTKQNGASFMDWFTGKDVDYSGSGWGHGPRQWLAKNLGLGNTASNLVELGLHSQLQNGSVDLSGGLLDNVKQIQQ